MNYINNIIKCLFFCCIIFFQIKDLFNLNIMREMMKLEEYFNLCDKKILIKQRKFKKYNKPSISIITPIYNKEQTLYRYMRSIQNQFLKNIEIILVDDQSNDKTLKVIEELQKDDERIILIKNNKRKGTLISRNLGVFLSKGEFLFFIDPDDMISKRILIHSYSLAKEYNYEMVRFNIYEGNYEINLPEIVMKLNNEPIYKPNMHLFLFYGLGKLWQLDYYITNKLIKRELFIKALNLINKYYLEQFMIDCEDGMINFMLYKLSESLYFTKKIGYYYIKTKKSISKKYGDFTRRLKSNFLYFKYIFETTKNNIIEKNILNYIFHEINYYHPDIIKLLGDIKEKKEKVFYKKIINSFIQNDFISLNSKETLKNMKNKILNSSLNHYKLIHH